MTKEELEKAYKTAWQGSLGPDLAVVSCGDCGKSFVLTRNGKNRLCKHLKNLFKDYDTKNQNLAARENR